MSLDVAANVHMATSGSDGSIHYQNNIPAPEASLADLLLRMMEWRLIKFIFESNSNGMIASHFWDLGDGTTSTASSGFHTYTEPGEYGFPDSRGAWWK